MVNFVWFDANALFWSMNTFDTIDSLLQEYKALLPLDSTQAKKLEAKFRLEFNYNSNHIEGNTLTYGETELLLIFDNTTGNHTLREYEEMRAHDVAFQTINNWAANKNRTLTEQDVKELNKLILVRPFWKDAITTDGQATRRLIKVGDYKAHPNSVRLANGEIFEYASPTDTPFEMQKLLVWFREQEPNLHPVMLAAMLHYKFVRIHPFDDGNGRISRLLMNYVLLRSGYPPAVIKSKDKNNYLFALNRADVGDIAAFVEYIGNQVIWSLQLAIKAGRGESIEEADDIGKKIEVFSRSLSGPDEVNEAKSEHSTQQAVSNVILPLLDEFELKAIVLAKHFHRWKRVINCSDGTETFGIGNGNEPGNPLRFFSNSRVLRSNKDDYSGINSLSYTYQLSGYKKSVKLESVEVGIRVEFHEFKYLIVFDDSVKSKQYLYGKPMSEDDRTTIISSLVGRIMSEMAVAK